MEALATDRDPAVAVYTANEPVQLRAQGYELTELRVADYVQLASNGLITNEKTISRGSRAGAPDGAAPSCAACAARSADSGRSLPDLAGVRRGPGQRTDPVQQQVLATSIELWQAERLGASSDQAWENMQTVLLDMGLLAEPLDLSQAFTNEFLP